MSQYHVTLIGGKSDGQKMVSNTLYSHTSFLYRAKITFTNLGDTVLPEDKVCEEDKYVLHHVVDGYYIGVHTSLTFSKAMERLVNRYPKKRRSKIRLI